MVALDNMESSILDHMASNVNYYKLFHMGHVLKDAPSTSNLEHIAKMYSI